MVYFISTPGLLGAVKIGFSQDPEDRCRRLYRQLVREGWTGTHLALDAIIPGGMGVEQVLHQRFAPARLHGEWFHGGMYELEQFVFDAMHFEGFWPMDQESPGVHRVLDVLREAEYPIPDCCYTDGWR